MLKNCERCGKPYKAWDTKKAKYCSRSCQVRRPISKVTRYRQVFHDGRYIAEHRAIIEKELGRRLTRRETVHHVNGNKLDNSRENLQLIDRADHARMHYLEQRARGQMQGGRKKA